MWRVRDKSTILLTLCLVLMLVAGAACDPDGPGGSLPTHPSDTYAVTLEWDAPTTDAVGRPLEDLSGYRLYYAETESPATSGTVIDVGSVNTITVRGLAAGDYLFAVTAYDADGNESDLSEPLPVEVGR